MKLRNILIAMVAMSAFALAQTSSTQTSAPTSNPHAQHHAAPATSADDQSAAKTGSQSKSADMTSHMAQMQKDMQDMRTHAQQMRSDAEKVQDPNTKSALLHNAEMWEMFLDRMQSHMQMMGGGMMGHGMMKHDMGGMQHQGSGSTATPKKP